MNDFKGQCREIVDGLRSTFRRIPTFQINGEDQRQDELQYILDNMKYTSRLEIFATTIEGLPLKIPVTTEDLFIYTGSWITLDYVMSLKMSTMVLCNTNLTNEDINVIFKSWMEMKSFQNLEHFEIDLTNRNDFVEVALKDIPYEKRPSITGPNPFYAQVDTIFEVTRRDGQKACIEVSELTQFFVTMRPRLPLLKFADSPE
ncbi:hypothetical protein B9Z55_004245 [Caenorhabditis nigoni]|nr:hypothetical protein B9Z55_004245 [Caenorhabditis nigoni]